MVAKVLGAGVAIALVAVATSPFQPYRHFAKPYRLLRALRSDCRSPPPSGTELGSGDEILDAAISPDERHIVFVATTDGVARLWRRALDSERAKRSPGTDGAQLPAWKQTGNVISFFASDRLKQVSLGRRRRPRSGDAECRVRRVVAARRLAAVCRRCARSRFVVSLNGAMSDATTLRPGDRSHTFPMIVGSSNAFVYIATLDDGRRMLRLVENGQERDLGTTSGHGASGGRQPSSRARRRAALATAGPRDAAAIRQRRACRTRCRRRPVRAQLLCRVGATADRRTGGETTAPAHVVLRWAAARARRRATRETTGKCVSLPTIATQPSRSPLRS